MHSNLKKILILALSALGAACAHSPPPPPVREPVVVNQSAPPQENEQLSDADAQAVAPSISMPQEWQHHNGEDYDDLFDRLRAGFAFDEVQEPAIDVQLNWFRNNPEYLERTFQRAQRYMYHIVTEVEARGMPLEFALLPVVESAYEPFAYSSSRAAGLWQFIAPTGERFGLKRDWWFDGRRDVIESTRAALDYLQALHDQFDGDWLLAIAAYNVGENTVLRELNFNKANGRPADFWHLRLPAETRAYVPKLLAMKRLMAEPERYGLAFAPIPNEPFFAVIDLGSQIDLKIAAQLAGTSYDDLIALNPGYNRWATDPEGPDRLLVPIDNADAFEAGLRSLSADERVRYATHEVTRKDTLAALARDYGSSSAVISHLNDLKGGKLVPGQTIKIPEITGQLPDKVLIAAARVDRPETDRGGRHQHQIVYRVHAGETLSSIARRHGISVSTLARLNDLNTQDRVVQGQRLVIKASSRHYRSEGTASGKRVTYTVRSGDTVYSISKQFQVSVPKLKSWNGLNKHHQIRAGQRLVMYVDAGKQQG
jgi:membrane-bound lytic murein transglycosylase D